MNQLQIGSWDILPRKYREMNVTVAAWLNEEIKDLPRLLWFGAYSKEKGTDGFISNHKRQFGQPTMHINCSVLSREIRETIYHEFLHLYLDKPEVTIVLYERCLLKGRTHKQAKILEDGWRHKERISAAR